LLRLPRFPQFFKSLKPFRTFNLIVGIASHLEHIALQDLSYVREFDAVITVDAMENIPPED
jgi:hypothetical protein